ncbi:MAG: hypothetical protein R2857_12050 [Vampirovibrionales bacterium]
MADPPAPVPPPAPAPPPTTINVTVVAPPPPPINVDVNVNVEAPQVTVNNQAQAEAQASAQVDTQANTVVSAQAELIKQANANAAKAVELRAQARQRQAPMFAQAKRRAKGSPLILDLDGNGLAFSSMAQGSLFDLNGDGLKEQVAWSTADAWLALDRNGNGTIDSGQELFGNQHGAANGFEELKKRDDNHDGVINSQDDVFTQLRTWIDANGDGVSQAEELKTLQEAGVEQLFLAYDESSATDTHGNEFRQISQLGFQRSGWLAQRVSQTQGISLAQALFGALIDVWLGFQQR